MEFDKSRIYTALNADELKVGSRVILSNYLFHLKEYVEGNENIRTLTKVFDGNYMCRFKTEGDAPYALAYLVEELEEKKLKWTDLKIGDVIRRRGEIRMITGISTVSDSSEMHIFNGVNWLTDDELEEWEKVEEW